MAQGERIKEAPPTISRLSHSIFRILLPSLSRLGTSASSLRRPSKYRDIQILSGPVGEGWGRTRARGAASRKRNGIAKDPAFEQ